MIENITGVEAKPTADVVSVDVQQSAFLGDVDGIAVVKMNGDGYSVAFEFDRQLSSIIRSVPGAEFKQDEISNEGLVQKVFMVPATSVDALGVAVNRMRTGHQAIAESLKDIMVRASGRRC